MEEREEPNGRKSERQKEEKDEAGGWADGTGSHLLKSCRHHWTLEADEERGCQREVEGGSTRELEGYNKDT